MPAYVIAGSLTSKVSCCAAPCAHRISVVTGLLRQTAQIISMRPSIQLRIGSGTPRGDKLFFWIPLPGIRPQLVWNISLSIALALIEVVS